jgi:rhamnose transport system substrate-binding protein
VKSKDCVGQIKLWVRITVIAALASLLLSGISVSGSHAANFKNKKIKIAFISQIEGIPYYVGFKNGGLQAAKDLKITYTHTGPVTIDSAEQVKMVGNFIKQKYSAIVVSPLDPTSIANSLAKAKAAGIHVGTSDADAPKSVREVFVAQADDVELGQAVMGALADPMGGTGEYGIVSAGADWATGNAWINAATKFQAAKFPNMKLVGGIRYTKNTAEALQEAQNLMTQFPNLKGIIAVPSTAVPGVSKAVENANMIGKVSVTGFGSPKTAAPFLESGAMTSTVLWDVTALGYLTVWAMYQIATGKKFLTKNKVPGFKDPVAYNPKTKRLLLGKPVVFTKADYKNYNF